MADRRRVTRDDVARIANTSVAVVSYVLNDGPRPVSAATRARVLSAVETTGYQPNAVARALARGRTGVYGVVMPDISNAFFAELVRELEEVALSRGKLILFGDSADSEKREAQLVAAFVAQQVDGIVLMAASPEPQLESLGSSSMRVVMLDRGSALPNAWSVSVDNRKGARVAVEHLISHGRSRIACIAGPPDLPPAAERVRGWRDSLDEAGYAPGPMEYAPLSREGGLIAGRRLLKEPGSFDAVFASNDQQAIGFIRAADEVGLAIPRDCALVSFDGSQDSYYALPSLTAIVQPVKELASRAIELLEADEGSVQHTVLDPELKIARSCGCE